MKIMKVLQFIVEFLPELLALLNRLAKKYPEELPTINKVLKYLNDFKIN
jgi:hypothetical protein